MIEAMRTDSRRASRRISASMDSCGPSVSTVVSKIPARFNARRHRTRTVNPPTPIRGGAEAGRTTSARCEVFETEGNSAAFVPRNLTEWVRLLKAVIL